MAERQGGVPINLSCMATSKGNKFHLNVSVPVLVKTRLIDIKIRFYIQRTLFITTVFFTKDFVIKLNLLL